MKNYTTEARERYGNTAAYIICPGIVSREYIVQQIPESLKNRDPNIAYYNTDGSRTF